MPESESLEEREKRLLFPDQSIKNATIASELALVTRTDRTGGLHWPDTLNALKWRFNEVEDVEIIATISEMELDQIPSFVEELVKGRTDKQWFAFTYPSDSQHMIGIVIDREKKQLRLYDHSDHFREQSLNNAPITRLAKSLGCDIIDGFKESPFTAQEEKWECGVLAVKVIEEDLAHSRTQRPPSVEKIVLDLKVEAEKILIAAYEEDHVSEKQHEIFMYFQSKWDSLFPGVERASWVNNALWAKSGHIARNLGQEVNTGQIVNQLKLEQDQFMSDLESKWKEFYPAQEIQPWMAAEFKKLEQNILKNPDAQLNIRNYFEGLLAEAPLHSDYKKVTDLLTFLELIPYEDEDYKDYANLLAYLNAYFTNLKKLLPGNSKEDKKKNLAQISYSRFFSHHHAAHPDYVLGKDTTTAVLLKAIEEKNLALFYVPELQWLFRSMNKQRQLIFARNLRIELYDKQDIYPDISLRIKKITDDLNQIKSGSASKGLKAEVKDVFLICVEIAKRMDDHTTVINIINYCKDNKIEQNGLTMLQPFIGKGEVRLALAKIVSTGDESLFRLLLEADKGGYTFIYHELRLLDFIRITKNAKMAQIYLQHLESINDMIETSTYLHHQLVVQVVDAIRQALKQSDVDFLRMVIHSSLIHERSIGAIFYTDLMAQDRPDEQLRAQLEDILNTEKKADGVVHKLLNAKPEELDDALALFKKVNISFDQLSTENIADLLSTSENKERLFNLFSPLAYKLDSKQITKVLASYKTNTLFQYLIQLNYLLSLNTKPVIEDIGDFIAYLTRNVRPKEFNELLNNLCTGLDESVRRKVLSFATYEVLVRSTSYSEVFFEAYPRDPQLISAAIAKLMYGGRSGTHSINYGFLGALVMITLLLLERPDNQLFRDFLEHFIEEVATGDFIYLLNTMKPDLEDPDLIVTLDDFLARAQRTYTQNIDEETSSSPKNSF